VSHRKVTPTGVETAGHRRFYDFVIEAASEMSRCLEHKQEVTMKALITRKVGMTSTIADDGTVQAITLLSASPCVVTQVKTDETDGYNAVQVGFEVAKEGKTPKASSVQFLAQTRAS
jgi:hypothetical protein